MCDHKHLIKFFPPISHIHGVISNTLNKSSSSQLLPSHIHGEYTKCTVIPYALATCTGKHFSTNISSSLILSQSYSQNKIKNRRSVKVICVSALSDCKSNVKSSAVQNKTQAKQPQVFSKEVALLTTKTLSIYDRYLFIECIFSVMQFSPPDILS